MAADPPAPELPLVLSTIEALDRLIARATASGLPIQVVADTLEARAEYLRERSDV